MPARDDQPNVVGPAVVKNRGRGRFGKGIKDVDEMDGWQIRGSVNSMQNAPAGSRGLSDDASEGDLTAGGKKKNVLHALEKSSR